MPELPEVETIRRDVAEVLLGRRITLVSVHIPQVVRYPAPELFVAELVGRRIVSAERIAKYLLMRLDDDRYWVVHLSLEGRFLYAEGGAHLATGTLLSVELDNGHQLILRDTVSYTKTMLLRPEDLGNVLKVHEFGPEPIDPGFTVEVLKGRLAGRRRMLKPALLDQRVIAGVGNIYVDEALFRARLHPERRVNTLTDDEWVALHLALVGVLNEGIAERGTTAPGGLYRDLFGRKGHHQDSLQVFRKAGEPCPRCGSVIRRTEVGGRSTYCCPFCQVI